jgi:hypothetical protein
MVRLRLPSGSPDCEALVICQSVLCRMSTFASRHSKHLVHGFGRRREHRGRAPRQHVLRRRAARIDRGRQSSRPATRASVQVPHRVARDSVGHRLQRPKVRLMRAALDRRCAAATASTFWHPGLPSFGLPSHSHERPARALGGRIPNNCRLPVISLIGCSKHLVTIPAVMGHVKARRHARCSRELHVSFESSVTCCRYCPLRA